MSDLIERQAAIDALVKPKVIDVYDHYWDGRNTQYKNDVDAIADLPATQPERKKGEWIKHPEQKNIYGGKCIECSECGEKYMVQYIEDEKYCRNCGADMRGEQK